MTSTPAWMYTSALANGTTSAVALSGPTPTNNFTPARIFAPTLTLHGTGPIANGIVYEGSNDCAGPFSSVQVVFTLSPALKIVWPSTLTWALTELSPCAGARAVT